MRRQKEIDKFNEILWRAIGEKNLDAVLDLVNRDPRFISTVAEAFVLHVTEDLPAVLSGDDAFEADMNRRGDAQEDFIPGSMVGRGTSY